MSKFLDLGGLRTFTSYIKQYVENKASSDSDIDNAVINNGDGGNGFVTVRNLAYYHKLLTDSQALNKTVETIVADALTSDSTNSIKESVETVVDSRMTWSSEYPSENI